MIWRAPAALAALLLIAGPVVVHLLARRYATRVVFPGMRFVPAVHGAAVRLRRPSDFLLLSLRAGAVAAAALAVAQPVVVTPARERAWASRVARAVVVDTSPSVDGSIAQPLADAELRDAPEALRFASGNVRDAIRRSEAWLRTAAGGTRELVIVSDFQAGTLAAADLAAVPPGTGIRFVRAGRPVPVRAGVTPADGWRGGRWRPSLSLADGQTAVIWTRTASASAAPVTVLAAPADAAAAARALAAARSFGVAAPDVARPIEIAFAGAPTGPAGTPSTPWIVTAAVALAADRLVSASAAPLAVGERGGMLAARTPLAASSPFAPAIVRAVLLAAAPGVADREQEPGVIDAATLMTWHRDPVPGAGGVPAEAEDGRWLWGGALALLIAEEVLRRRAGATRAEETHARAA